MSINQSEWLVEKEWLERVVREIRRQLEEKLINKYENMISSPYFARMDFKEDGEGKVEKCYLGISNLINEEFDFLIYDWRAPISSMFYDYEVGDAYYKCPEGTIKGEISMKRQYKISDGKINYMFDSSIKIDDEILQDILSKSSDNKMKAIITTIQKEQNKAIRNEKYKNLIVQGPAGSGKTSVALHRIAYLLYKHRDSVTSKNIVIFSPNNIFNDYISNVLPQLGEDNILQTTFKEYMHKVLEDIEGKEDYYDMMESIFGDRSEESYDIRIKNLKFKSSVEFVNLLKAYIKYLEEKTRFDLMDCYKNFYINLEQLLKLENIEYDDESIREIKRYTLENLKAKKINYEDQVALLFIRGVVGCIPRTEEVKYIIIDEAQDYTPLQYEIFMEITKFSRKILNEEIHDEYVERSGDRPTITAFLDEEGIKKMVIIQ